MKTRADWLNENSYRAFPFVEDSSGLCTDGVAMPDWVLLDAAAMVTPGTFSKEMPEHFMEVVSFKVNDSWAGSLRPDGSDFQRFLVATEVKFSINYVGSDGISRSNLIVMSTQYGAGGEGVVTPSGWVSQACRTFLLDGFSGLLRESYLKVAFGTPADLDNPAPGVSPSSFYGVEHVLATPRPILDTRCVYRPGGFGISSLIGSGGGTPSLNNNGNRKVYLQNGYNTTLGINGGKIVLGISPGAGLGKECPDQTQSPLYGMFYVNGQHVDSDGNFTVYAGPGIKIGSGSWNGIPGITVATDGKIDAMLGRT